MSGKWSQAEMEEKRALKFDRNNPEVLNNLAVILDKEAKPKKALEELEKAAQIWPDNPLILLNMARLELETGDKEKALEIAQRILERNIWPTGFRTLMGKIDIDLARYGEAHLFLHEAFERHPGNPLILTYLGIVHFRLENFSESRKDFREALILHPSRELRRYLLLLIKDPEGALDRNRKPIPGLSGPSVGKEKDKSIQDPFFSQDDRVK